jgi:hypothetical protein
MKDPERQSDHSVSFSTDIKTGGAISPIPLTLTIFLKINQSKRHDMLCLRTYGGRWMWSL